MHEAEEKAPSCGEAPAGREGCVSGTTREDI